MPDLLRALSLLSTLPVRPSWDEQQAPGRVMAAYPLAGAVIGLALAVLAWLMGTLDVARVAPLLPAALMTTAWAGLTGALHLDGWADCCDGLFVPVARERRLEIMKDPRLGSFGGVGLACLLIVKLAAIQGVLAIGTGAGEQGWAMLRTLLPWLAIPALARWAAVVTAWAFPPAKPEGMAAYFRRGLGRRELLIATATVLPFVVALGLGGLPLWLAAALTLWGMARLAMARLGGLTGDVYGGTIELAETAMLLALCLWGL
jgi:adenosylcobinamide-GDP ribazoletransferase